MFFFPPKEILLFSILLFFIQTATAEQKWECFDRDPGWEGVNNRSTAIEPAKVVQDFGYSPPAGDLPGRIGGVISQDGNPAYYGKPIAPLTLEEPFSASGKLVLEKGAGNLLLGFFNSQTLNEWRTPNTFVFRINGRGEFFHNHIEYTTRLWKAQATVIGRHDIEKDRVYPIEVPSGPEWHSWSFRYDPKAADGKGMMYATFDNEKAEWELLPGHREEGATFDRFGLLNVLKSVDSPGTVWVSDLTINGERIDLSTDPGWDSYHNRLTYPSREIRPLFDFGYSPTQYAGGRDPGEIGGLIFRGDCRYPERMACYGDKVQNLSLETPLYVSGKVTLRKGVSDSSAMIGYYNSKKSMESNPAQDRGLPKDFLGVVIEGPSADGFNFYPAYRASGDSESAGRGENPPPIYPDGAFRAWSLQYDPQGADGNGSLTVTLDGHSVTMNLHPGDKAEGANFDRFGIVTPWIDGNGQDVYFDDLFYTWKN